MARVLIEGFKNLSNWNLVITNKENIFYPYCDSSDESFFGQNYVELDDTSIYEGQSLSRTIEPKQELYVSFFLKIRKVNNNSRYIFSFFSGYTRLGGLCLSNPGASVGGFDLFYDTYDKKLISTLDKLPIISEDYDRIYHIEIYYKPSRTNGAAALKVDGNLIGSVNDTKTSEEDFMINTVVIQDISGLSPGLRMAGLIIDDSNWIGKKFVVSQLPSGSGYYDEFLSTPEENYENVRGYLISQIGGFRPFFKPEVLNYSNIEAMDSFTHEGIRRKGVSFGPVALDVQIDKRGNSSLSKNKSFVRINGQNYFSEEHDICFGNYQYIMEKNPADNNQWSKESINSIEIGYKVE